MHFSTSLHYRHLLHTVSSSSVRRSGTISSTHRADGRSELIIAPTGVISSRFIAPTGDHQ
jgi:hypothetical protein